MRLALTLDVYQAEDLLFAQQIGVNDIVAEMGDKPWDTPTLAALHNRVVKAGLNLAGIENLPQTWYTQAILGQPGRDAEIARVCAAIEAAGAAEIKLIGYRWSLPTLRRTEQSPTGRAGAVVTAYDHALAERAPQIEPPVGEAAMWDNLAYFLDRVIPVAEKVGVRLACHPDDPPVPVLGGVARVLGTLAGLKRFLDLIASDCHGLDLCQGTLATMPDTNVVEAIQHLGRRKKIFMVHLRNPQRTEGGFREAFLDEGDTVMFHALQAYRAVGYEGILRTAAMPGVVGDTPWGHKSQAFAIGYLRALAQAIA